MNLEQVRRGLAWRYQQYQKEQDALDRASYAMAETVRRARRDAWALRKPKGYPGAAAAAAQPAPAAEPPPPPPAPPDLHAGLTRVEKALLALDPKGLGLEIAPSFRPIALASPAAPLVRDRRGCA